MNRKQEQAELIFKLGLLMGPPMKVAENPGNFDAEERTRVMARFFAERNEFITLVRRYVENEPGHCYRPQFQRIQSLLSSIQSQAAVYPDDEAALLKLIIDASPELLRTILSIPVPVESAIHEALTPFSTYCLIKGLCNTAINETGQSQSRRGIGATHFVCPK